MEALQIIPDLEQQPLREANEPYAVIPYEGQVIVGGMGNATVNGKPGVMIFIEDPETGGYIAIQTTLALFLAAGDALKARHGDPREE